MARPRQVREFQVGFPGSPKIHSCRVPSSGTGIYWRQRGLVTNWDRRKGLCVPPFTSTDAKHVPSTSPSCGASGERANPSQLAFLLFDARARLGGLQGDNADRGFSAYLGLRQYPHVGA